MDYIKHERAGYTPTALVGTVAEPVHVTGAEMLDLAMGEPVTREAEAHVKTCASCRQSLHDIQFADALMRRSLRD